MHRCACPQSHPHFVPVRLRCKAGRDGRFDPRTGEVAPRQVAFKRLRPVCAAGCDEPSQVKLHSTHLKSCLVSIAPNGARVKPQIAHRQEKFLSPVPDKAGAPSAHRPVRFPFKGQKVISYRYFLTLWGSMVSSALTVTVTRTLSPAMAAISSSTTPRRLMSWSSTLRMPSM